MTSEDGLVLKSNSDKEFCQRKPDAEWPWLTRSQLQMIAVDIRIARGPFFCIATTKLPLIITTHMRYTVCSHAHIDIDSVFIIYDPFVRSGG